MAGHVIGWQCTASVQPALSLVIYALLSFQHCQACAQVWAVIYDVSWLLLLTMMPS
jgi:hypothetical protein